MGVPMGPERAPGGPFDEMMPQAGEITEQMSVGQENEGLGLMENTLDQAQEDRGSNPDESVLLTSPFAQLFGGLGQLLRVARDSRGPG